MSTSVWGIVVSGFFALIGLFAPIPEQWKLSLFIFSAVGFVVACCGWLIAYRRERRASQPDAEKYYKVLRKLADKKEQKAREEIQEGRTKIENIERRRIPFHEERVGFLQYDKLEYHNSSFIAGESFGVTVWFKNRGAFPVYDAQGFAFLIYGPPSIESDIFRLTREAVSKQRRPDDGNQVAADGALYYPTEVRLTQEQIDSVLAGRDRIYLVTFAEWKTADGSQVTPGWESCSWMEPPGSDHFNPLIIKWRLCSKVTQAPQFDVAGRAEF